MGGDQFGGYGWGKVDFQEFGRVIATAIDNGINYFDTADIYGLGKSEEFLGKELKGYRNHLIIQSKFGVRIENGHTFYDNTPAWINTAVGESLHRLQTDYIDIYYVHYRDGVTPIEDVIDTLNKLREKGYIRHFGISNFPEEEIHKLQRDMFVGAQYEFSLAYRKNEKKLVRSQDELGCTPVTWGSLGRGVLTGKYQNLDKMDPTDKRFREQDYNFHGKSYEKNLKIVDIMRQIAEEHQLPLSAVAIRFIFDHLKDSVAIVGSKNTMQLQQNFQSIGWTLSTDELKRLNQISLSLE